MPDTAASDSASLLCIMNRAVIPYVGASAGREDLRRIPADGLLGDCARSYITPFDYMTFIPKLLNMSDCEISVLCRRA